MRRLSTLQSFRTSHGSFKVDLSSKALVGVSQSRGERLYQEDTYAVHSLDLPTSSLHTNISSNRAKNIAVANNNAVKVNSAGTSQVAYFGVFDGHAGSEVSTYLCNSLHTLLQNAKPQNAPALVSNYQNLGGYLRRYTCEPLQSLLPSSSSSSLSSQQSSLTLEQRATMAFLQADLDVCKDPNIAKSGAVATVAILHSLSDPPLPFFASPSLLLFLAHAGDTVAVLCSAETGHSTRLTETHHAESRSEGERLRKTGTGLITDSFGESRWAGYVANTRAIGDKQFKKFGVIGEPETYTKLLHDASQWSFLVLMSDGVTSVVSDQEVVDLCRDRSDPSQAAHAVISFAEDVGTEDNATCIVIPLPGWKKVGGHDSTQSLREFRLRQSVGNRQRRM